MYEKTSLFNLENLIYKTNYKIKKNLLKFVKDLCIIIFNCV